MEAAVQTRAGSLEGCLALREWGAGLIPGRGVAALAYAEEAGAGGLLYAMGADARVVALETGAGEQVLRFKAGKHPLRAAAASPGDAG